MSEHHRVEAVRIEGGVLHLTVDGQDLAYPLKDVSTLLAAAKDEDLQAFEVSPSGYGIHWSSLDEDISIDGLLGILHDRVSPRKSA